MSSDVVRPFLEELRLRSFKSHRLSALPLGPLTVLHGPSGAGKSNVLDALEVLSRLAVGEPAGEALDGGGRGPLAEPVRGGSAGCAPHGERSFVVGCTVRTSCGPVRLDVAVRTDGGPRIVGERLRDTGRILLRTGEQDAARGRINVTWYNDSRQGDIRAPFPDDALITSQVPLRVAGASAGERRVLTAAEQVLTALREVFTADPVPRLMRGWTAADPRARLTRSAANISAVLARLQGECRHRYGRLAGALRTAAPHPLSGLGVERREGPGGVAEVLAVLDEGALGRTTADRAADGMLRYLAFAAVLLTGADVLDVDPAAEVPWERRLLTVAVEDPGAGLSRRQTADLLRLARLTGESGHARVLAVLQDADTAREAPGAVPVACARDPRTGHSVLRPEPVPGAEAGAGAGAAAGAGAGAEAEPGSGRVPAQPFRGADREDAVDLVR
ncbi:ATP-binding protein [Streptacidiphilus sp. ASG 303]|uniref:AAA family ATPase n=1 Tax=Streptacidiphilus sp. ASG 303 TaxID=2896847 RepID=UPI001E32C364|nr:ATP-binding protein [Streptacidiphilus sp. ASG 303]MCD0486237.1 ATP-binding protein [Streptacidiphilus sp. ASG 303]